MWALLRCNGGKRRHERLWVALECRPIMRPATSGNGGARHEFLQGCSARARARAVVSYGNPVREKISISAGDVEIICILACIPCQLSSNEFWILADERIRGTRHNCLYDVRAEGSTGACTMANCNQPRI